MGKWQDRLSRGGHDYKLMPAQERAIDIVVENDGGYLAIPVGHGKTLLSFCIASVMPCKRPLVICPSRLLNQGLAAFTHWDAYYNLKPCYMTTYERMSSAKSVDMLWDLKPDLIVLDEAHCVMNENNTRSKRLKEYIKDNSDTIIVAMSGTLFKRDLHVMYFLSICTLRDNTFISRSSWERSCMTAALFNSEDSTYEQRAVTHRCLEKYKGESLRAQYRNMLESSKGVYIPAPKEGISSSLELVRVAPSVPDIVCRALAELDAGTIDICSHMEEEDACTSKAKQVASGFYYAYDWDAVGGKDIHWVLAKTRWYTTLNNELEYRSTRGYDSRFLITSRVIREVKKGERKDIHCAWMQWDKHRHKPEPPKLTHHISDFLWVWLEKRLAKAEPTLIWCSYIAQFTALQQRGYTLLDNVPKSDWGKTHALVSHYRHGKGLELQMWHSNIILTPTGNSTTVEQLLGRTHRYGQIADVVSATFCTHVLYAEILNKAIKNADIDCESTGAKQKLLYATWVEDNA